MKISLLLTGKLALLLAAHHVEATVAGAVLHTDNDVINSNSYQNGYVLVFPAPIPAQVDAVYIDIRVFATL